MNLPVLWTQIAFAIAGGAVAEFLHWYMLAKKPEGIRPYLPKPEYWLFTGGMILLGGLMPVLYISGEASALLSFHLGATTPIALQKLMSAAPNLVVQQGPARAAGNGGFRSFVTW